MTPSSKVSAYLDLERQADESDGRPAPDLAIKLDAAWRLLTPDEIRWIRARRDDQRNPFEESARSKKVLALLAKVPVGANRDANRITAEWLVGMSPAERGLFAQMAGCKAPSSETWRQLVEAVKQRRTVEEMESEDPFARARGDR